MVLPGQRIYDITHAGKITAYTYDETSRLIRVVARTIPKHPWNNSWHNRGDGSINPFTRDVSYGYDSIGRMTTSTARRPESSRKR